MRNVNDATELSFAFDNPKWEAQQYIDVSQEY